MSLDNAVQWSVGGRNSRANPKFGVKERAHTVFGCLDAALFLLRGYSWPRLLLDLKDGLQGDITRCMELAKTHEAYCTCMDDYKGFMPKKTWVKCDLCVYLQKFEITEKYAEQICKVLGASEVKHWAYVEAGDLVGPSIPGSIVLILLYI